jgi:hypothetical protein
MGGDELLPSGILSPFGRWRNPVPAKDVSRSESGSLGIGKVQSRWKVRSQDAILRDENSVYRRNF